MEKIEKYIENIKNETTKYVNNNSNIFDKLKEEILNYENQNIETQIQQGKELIAQKFVINEALKIVSERLHNKELEIEQLRKKIRKEKKKIKKEKKLNNPKSGNKGISYSDGDCSISIENSDKSDDDETKLLRIQRLEDRYVDKRDLTDYDCSPNSNSDDDMEEFCKPFEAFVSRVNNF